MSVPQISMIAVRSATAERFDVLPYDEPFVVQLDDRCPELYFAATSNRIALERGGDGERKQLAPEVITSAGLPAEGLTWFSWKPLGGEIAEQRRFGTFAARLRGAPEARLECYLWPASLFDRAQLVRILAEIEAELGCAVVWDAANLRSRAHAEAIRSAGGQRDLLIQDVDQELGCAQGLVLLPYRELGVLSRSHTTDVLDDLPEHRLMSAWCRKRVADLLQHESALMATLREVEARLSSCGPKRAAEVRRERDDCSQRLSELRTVQTRVWSLFAHVRHLQSEVAVTPAVQRDFRLRRLLQAFQSKLSERPIMDQSSYSALPMLKAPDIFEVWGAVRMVRALRELGWTGDAPHVTGPPTHGFAGSITHAVWTLSREGERLRFEFQPTSIQVNLGDAPGLHERTISRWTWAAEQIEERDTLLSGKERSPDYLLIWSSGDCCAFAIGDASLANPEFSDGTKKIEKVGRYQAELRWKSGDDRLLSCQEPNAFVVFPGPRTRWTGAAEQEASKEHRLICPVPEPDDEVARLEVARLVDGLREAGRRRAGETRLEHASES